MSDLTPEAREELARLADAATDGPWESTWNGVQQSIEAATKVGEYKYEGVGIVPEEYVRDEDAEFIAAFNPETARALLDALTRAETERDWNHRSSREAKKRALRAEARLKAVQQLVDQADRDGHAHITASQVQWAIDGTVPPPTE